MGELFRLADPAAGTPLSFPGLGLHFVINREALSIGSLTVYWYGIIVVTGVMLGVWYATWRVGQFGVDRDRFSDVLLASIVCGFIGARVYYVAFSWDYYRIHPDEILTIWKGGIAFYGGVIGALLAACFCCRRWKLPILRCTDAGLGGLLLGQSIGRWGNFMNIEAFGDYFDGPWRMVSPAIDRYFQARPDLLPGFSPEQIASMSDIPVHPTFFYESCWTLLGFLFLLFYSRRKAFSGELTLFFFFWNGLGRFFIEGLRTDSLMIGPIRVSQLLAALMVVASAFLWLWAKKRLASGHPPACFSTEIPPVAYGSKKPPADPAQEDLPPAKADDMKSRE